MYSIRILPRLVFLLLLTIPLLSLAGNDMPRHINYQGLLLDQGVPFTGDAEFKFALVDTNTGAYFWSNDGTFGEPGSLVRVPVDNGVFSVLLGAPPMADLSPEAVTGFSSGHALRIWVSTGDEPVLLGDLPLSSVLFAHRAKYAQGSAANFVAEGQIWSTTEGFKFPDGTVQTTAATGGGTGVGTLDEAYDVGRIITADAGAVAIQGPGGLEVEGAAGFGVTAPQAPLQVSSNQWDVTNGNGDLLVGTPAHGLRVGVAVSGVGAGIARVRVAGGANEMRLGAGTLDVMIIDPTGISVTEGPFRVAENGMVGVVGDFGGGEAGAAVRAENSNASGIGLWAETAGADATIVAVQTGAGAILKGFQGNTEKFRVDNEGRMVGTGLNVTDGSFQVTNDGQVSVVGDFGSGESGAALRTENSNGHGIALWAESAGTDAATVIKQTGTGDLVRGFQGGTLKFRVAAEGQVTTPSVTITGGADLCEPFTTTEAPGGVEPGSVLVIDPDNPGSLTLSGQPYDTRVAGIASGAGGVNPGLTLSQQGVFEGGQQVALSGRVFVRASTENGPIRPGDMLTSSNRPGLAMRATDRERSFGAVIGKAMTPLASGEGLVLVLVGLQ